LCLFAKRLEQGRFAWPGITDGAMRLSGVQLGDAWEFLQRCTL
jgi:transposase